MQINREINMFILACLILFLLISMAVSVYSLNALKNEEIRSIREMLLMERKSQLRDVVQNAYSVLESANFYEPAQNAINRMRFGEKKQNYFFVVDTGAMFWVHPARPDLVGKNGRNQTDAKGGRYVQKILEQAALHKEGFVRYEQLEPGETEKSVKLVRYKLFEKWDWVLCAGIHIGDIDAIVSRHGAGIQGAMFAQVRHIAAGGLAALVLVSFLSFRFFNSRLVKPIKEVTRAMENCMNGNFSTDIRVRSNREIKALADATQRMQNSFSVAYRRLKTRPVPARSVPETDQPAKRLHTVK
jgi:signal transduction histidine kinase